MDICLYTQEFGVTGTLGALSPPALEAPYRPSPSLARAVHLLRINLTCATTMAPVLGRRASYTMSRNANVRSQHALDHACKLLAAFRSKITNVMTTTR